MNFFLTEANFKEIVLPQDLLVKHTMDKYDISYTK